MEVLVEDADIRHDGARPAGPAESMLVRDGRIAAIGPAAAGPRGGRGRRAVVRLDGATVIPGLIDAHCHVSDVGYLAAGADCSQPSAPDIAAIQARLREAAGRTPAGSWVTGQRVRGVQAAREPAPDPGRPGRRPCRTARRCSTTRRCTPAC